MSIVQKSDTPKDDVVNSSSVKSYEPRKKVPKLAKVSKDLAARVFHISFNKRLTSKDRNAIRELAEASL